MPIVRVGLVAIAGVVTSFSFSPHFWFLAIVGFAAFAWAIDVDSSRQRTFLALTFATFFYAPLVRWITIIGVPAAFALVVLCVLPWVIFVLYRPGPSRASTAFRLAAIVALIEAIHSNTPWGGFPWGLFAYSQVDGPLMPVSRVGGEVLTSMVVVLAGCALFVALVDRTFSMCVLIFAFVAVSSVTLINNEKSTTIRVAVIQGNVPRLGLSDQEQAGRVFANHIAQTHELAMDIRNGKAKQPQLVVWPENAADGDPVNSRAMFNQVQKVVDEVNAPVLIGAAVWDGDVGPYNAGILWLPGVGPNQRYEKMQLVPFGEYIPHRTILEKYSSTFGITPNHFLPGQRSGNITYGKLTFADVICFEVAYDSRMRAGIQGGAHFFTVQSNNATYAFSQQPMQQLQITRFRAFEHGRSIAVATTTGFSAIIDSRGFVKAQSQEMKSATLNEELDQFTVRQPIDRWGSGPWLAFCAVVVLLSLRKDSGWKTHRSQIKRFGRVK